MRFSAFFTLVICLFLSFSANPDNRVRPSITEATVYRSGAKLTSVANVRVPAGNSEVIFENLSPYFNPNSLQVRIKGRAALLSAVFQMKTPGAAPENPRAQTIRDSIVLLNDEAYRIQQAVELIKTERQALNGKIQQVGQGTQGSNTITMSVNELRELLTYYRTRLAELNETELQTNIRQRKLNELRQKLEEDLVRLQPNVANQTGEIVLKLDATDAGSIEIACTYLITQAYWTPLYDLRSDGLEKPLKLMYRASVINQSGFDWKGVKLFLSSAMPLSNNDRPVLSPLFVDFRPVAYPGVARQMATEQAVNLYQLQNAKEVLDDAAASQPVSALVEDEFLATFELTKPQDIQADGQANIVLVDQLDIPAQYEYHTVPKLDAGVFLLAKVTDYGKYNLLPGPANIFYQDTYVGQTSLNPNVTTDTMLLSLGRDEQIVVKRTQPKDFKERRRLFSKTVRENYAYDITVKNNKTIPISLSILDQVPVSKREEIKVELEEKSGAAYDEESGKLQWEITIPPGQNKRLRFSYSIEYPKDKAVQQGRG
ncbi:MAG: DUF4139 domain-containing protein [Saprospiraceae bacterium]|nr:DUF4139 domain-containing protein [Saprospiraceae bacterium]